MLRTMYSAEKANRGVTHPDMDLDAGIVHPELVWSVTAFGAASFTPSTMSTSPKLGQLFSAVSQAAGHVPHP